MPKFEDFTFESSTGINVLHARRCIPDGKPEPNKYGESPKYVLQQ